MADVETMSYMESCGEFCILDVGCGIGTATIAFVDFIDKAIAHGIVKRKTPLKIKPILLDLYPETIEAAKQMLHDMNTCLPAHSSALQVMDATAYPCSLFQTPGILEQNRHHLFDFMMITNVFNQALLEECPLPNLLSDRVRGSDTRPCDRPKAFGDMLACVGKNANPLFSRALLLQESRYAHLIGVTLPSPDIEVVHTSMQQKPICPDVKEETMAVPFGYACYKYQYTNRSWGMPEMLRLSPLNGIE
jgi:hypothetical protein